MASINQKLNNSIETLTNINGLDRIYLNYIINLLSFKSTVYELNDYAKQFIILLKYIININNNLLVSELKPNLESILVTYIFDLTKLLNNSLDIKNTDCLQRYQNLVIANKNIIEIVKNYNQYDEYICQDVKILKKMLLQI